jgi:2',3'-cyclic-nucleotide 2'-phosphodiesterase (5'-nucleotidase family)
VWGKLGWNLTLVHTGDTFGAVVAVNVANNPCTPTNTSYTSDLPFCLGGVARRAALISQLRSTYAHTLVVDTGNALPGTCWSSHFIAFFRASLFSALVGAAGWSVA